MKKLRKRQTPWLDDPDEPITEEQKKRTKRWFDNEQNPRHKK